MSESGFEFLGEGTFVRNLPHGRQLISAYDRGPHFTCKVGYHPAVYLWLWNWWKQPTDFIPVGGGFTNSCVSLVGLVSESWAPWKGEKNRIQDIAKVALSEGVEYLDALQDARNCSENVGVAPAWLRPIAFEVSGNPSMARGFWLDFETELKLLAKYLEPNDEDWFRQASFISRWLGIDMIDTPKLSVLESRFQLDVDEAIEQLKYAIDNGPFFGPVAA